MNIEKLGRYVSVFYRLAWTQPSKEWWSKGDNVWAETGTFDINTMIPRKNAVRILEMLANQIGMGHQMAKVNLELPKINMPVYLIPSKTNSGYCGGDKIVLKIRPTDILTEEALQILYHEIQHAIRHKDLDVNAAIYSIVTEFVSYLQSGMNRTDAYRLVYDEYSEYRKVLKHYTNALMSLPITELENMGWVHYDNSAGEQEAEIGALINLVRRPEHVQEVWALANNGDVKSLADYLETVYAMMNETPLSRGILEGAAKTLIERAKAKSATP